MPDWPSGHNRLRSPLQAVGKLAAVIIVAAACAGCGRSPERVFAELKDAALNKDAAKIWENLSPDTHADLAVRAAGLFREDARSAYPDGRRQAASVGEGREYLAILAGNLEDFSIEYIWTLRPAQVKVTGDSAEMTLASLRFGRPEKTLAFRRHDGKWLWDAREILSWYLENRQAIAGMSQGGS